MTNPNIGVRCAEVPPRADQQFSCGRLPSPWKAGSMRMPSDEQLETFRCSRNVAGWSYEQKAMFPEAIEHFQAAVKAMDATTMPVASLGHGFAVSGQKTQALEVLSKLFERAKKEYISASDIAIIYAGLGDRDQAFKWLDQASVDRSGYLVHVSWDRRLDYLHSDPRFERLLKRIGLPSSGGTAGMQGIAELPVISERSTENHDR